MSEKMYTVSEAVRLIGVESHVLRYWEEELKIPIHRTSQGHRSYSQQDVDTFRQVKEWKESGLQLKAIRRLLDQDGEEEIWFREKLREISPGTSDCGNMEDIQNISSTQDRDNRNDAIICEIVPVKEPEGSLERFTAVLKQMMEEVAWEQNEKLEQIIEACIREKMEELYLQYFQIMQEAAAAHEHEGKKIRKSSLKKLLHRLLGH